MIENPDNVLKEIEYILNLLQGVHVLDIAGSLTSTRIDLTIESHESHLILEHCAEASNVPLHCWAHFEPGSKEAISNPALALRYSYRIVSENGNSDQALDDLCMLGAFLTWTIYKVGIISGNKEKQLVKVFNASSRSQ